MLKQLSVLVENRKGVLLEVTEALAGNGINIMGSATDSGSEYGTIRLVPSDPDLGKQVLRDAGFVCKVKEVIGVEIEDAPGSMAAFLRVIEDINVNIDYTYLCYNRENGHPMIIIHTESIEEVASALTMKGLKIH